MPSYAVPGSGRGNHAALWPSLEQLRQLDACFGLPDEAFERTHIDGGNYFEILTCRAHGRRFLRDVVGGFAMSTRVTLLSDDDEDDPYQAWRTYHGQSEAWHARRGRSY